MSCAWLINAESGAPTLPRSHCSWVSPSPSMAYELVCYITLHTQAKLAWNAVYVKDGFPSSVAGEETIVGILATHT